MVAHLPLLRLSVCIALVIAFVPAVRAQGETVLRGNAVTEAKLLEALTPPPNEAGDLDISSMRTRSLRVSPRPGTATSTTHKRPAAALLITFETSSATLTASARQLLDVVAATLNNDKLKPFTFTIVGHADQRGSADANLVLSQQRAEAVRQYLVGPRRVPAEKVTAIGKGDTEPLNRADIAAAENRRVAFVTNAP